MNFKLKKRVIFILLFGTMSYCEAVFSGAFSGSNGGGSFARSFGGAGAAAAASSSGNGGLVESESSSGGSGAAASASSSGNGVGVAQSESLGGGNGGFEHEYSGSNAKGSYDIKYGRDENGDNFYIQAGPDEQFVEKEGNILIIGKGSHTETYELLDGKIVLLHSTTAGVSTTSGGSTRTDATESMDSPVSQGTLTGGSTASDGTSDSTGTGTTSTSTDTTVSAGETTGIGTTDSSGTSGSAGIGVTGLTLPPSLTPLIDVVLDLGIYLDFPMKDSDTTDSLPADLLDKSFSQIVDIMRNLEKEGITPSIVVEKSMR